MSKRSSCIAAACALAAISSAAYGESPRFNMAIATLADDESGRSTDLDVSFAPNTRWTLDAGVGSSKARSDAADIDGTSWRAGIDVHSERFGLRGYYRNYSDSNNFDTDTVGARASVYSGSLSLSLIAETRGFDVEYT